MARSPNFTPPRAEDKNFLDHQARTQIRGEPGIKIGVRRDLEQVDAGEEELGEI